MPIYVPGKLVLRKGWQPMDTDAAAYITAVETADTEPLEEKTKIAIDNFVLGCKADGIWTAIKASCILAGARTLTGALVPLVGAAPTNVGPFVSGDYNRKTGLVGDGSTKYLDSNRASNAESQDSIHQSIYVTTLPAGGIAFIGVGNIGANSTNITTTLHRSRSGSSVSWTAAIGFNGTSRSSSTSYLSRTSLASSVNNITSSSADTLTHHVFSRNAGAPNQVSNSRLAFYSIGESLDLALLDTRVTDLINAFAAAIP
jgi:hypothetical protein